MKTREGGGRAGRMKGKRIGGGEKTGWYRKRRSKKEILTKLANIRKLEVIKR